jgi:nucleoside-diphosphate-sugar epimerase
MNFVLGARGRLGSAIAASSELGDTVALDRSIYTHWAREGAAGDVARYFEKTVGQKAAGHVFVATGITDPSRSQEEHHSVNYVLARNVVEGAYECGLRIMTFGTVMETIAGERSENPYFASKVRLGNFVGEFSAKYGDALHVRTHTLFGGRLPEDFMFLGQMRNAITRGVRFDMSDGLQLREYHHIDDEVKAIAKFIQSNARGVVELSHGSSFRLRDLAIYVFKAFDCPDSLNVGAMPTSRHENFDFVFPRSPLLGELQFRDTFPAVVEYLRACNT